MMANVFKIITVFAIFLSFSLKIEAQNFVFAELGGIPLNTAGWNLEGAAYVGNTGSNSGNGELILTNPITTQSGSIFFSQSIDLAVCTKWFAEFDFRISDGNAADGLAFCYINTPPTGFVTGQGLGIPATADGLKVCFDTYLNCGTEPVPKIEIRYGLGYTECNGQPTVSNINGTLQFLRGNNVYNHCKVEYDNGNISVFVNGLLFLTGFQTFNFQGYFGFTASTGGFYDKHSIKNVIIYTQKPPSIAGLSASICPNDTIEIGGPNNPDFLYNWTPAVGLSNAHIANPTVTLDNTGATFFTQTYYLQTSLATIPGCGSTDSVVVKVNPTPRPDFTASTACLPNAQILFTNQTLINNSPANNATTYTWNFGDPLANVTNPNISFLTNANHNYSLPGPYTVMLAAISEDGCSADTIININSIMAKPIAQFQLPAQACAKAVVGFADASSNLNATQWFWDFGDGATSSIQNPNHVYNSANTYLVSFWYKNANGCPSDTIKKNITITDSPQILFGNFPSVCQADPPISIATAVVTNGMMGMGFYKGVGVSPSGVFTPLANGSSNSLITYVFASTTGCVDSISKPIIVNPLPMIDAGSDKIIIAGNAVMLTATASANTILAIWLPNIFINNNTIINPIVSPLADTKYCLTATTDSGCMATDSVIVKVLPALKVPNAFSPNGDGINDVWEIAGLNAYAEAQVEIFDRYGRKIFTSLGYNKPWDATLSGKKLPLGTYYFIIHLKNEMPKLTGSVTVIR